MTRLRAALIGLGVMGRQHARVLGSLDGVDLVAVADPVAADRPGLDCAVLASVDEILAVGVDYCVVAVPTALHEEVGLKLADAGVHALIEKPLAPDVAGAARLADAFESRGLVGAVGHIERYNPALNQVRQRLDAGELGEVYQIATRRQGPFPARIADVGVVTDLATHDIDLTTWIARKPFVSIAARTAFRSGRKHEDLVSAVGSLAGGIVTSHLVNWLSPLKERVTVITGDKGTFVVDTLTADLTFYANGTVPTEWDSVARFRGVTEGDMTRFAFPKPEPLRCEHEAFRDAVAGKDAQIVAMREGLTTVCVAAEMLRAADQGITVQL